MYRTASLLTFNMIFSKTYRIYKEDRNADIFKTTLKIRPYYSGRRNSRALFRVLIRCVLLQPNTHLVHQPEPFPSFLFCLNFYKCLVICNADTCRCQHILFTIYNNVFSTITYSKMQIYKEIIIILSL